MLDTRFISKYVGSGYPSFLILQLNLFGSRPEVTTEMGFICGAGNTPTKSSRILQLAYFAISERNKLVGAVGLLNFVQNVLLECSADQTENGHSGRLLLQPSLPDFMTGRRKQSGDMTIRRSPL